MNPARILRWGGRREKDEEEGEELLLGGGFVYLLFSSSLCFVCVCVCVSLSLSLLFCCYWKTQILCSACVVEMNIVRNTETGRM